MTSIQENDWNKIKNHKDLLLEKYCDGVFDKLQQTLEKRKEGSHRAYLEMLNILNLEDDNRAMMFDDLNRSTAIFKLAMWKKNGLLEDQEFRQFSKETQSMVASLLEL